MPEPAHLKSCCLSSSIPHTYLRTAPPLRLGCGHTSTSLPFPASAGSRHSPSQLPALEDDRPQQADSRVTRSRQAQGTLPSALARVPSPPQHERRRARTQILKMSERHPGEACTGEGNEADTPLSFKYASFRDFCSTSSSQDSGYSELLKSYSFENTDKEFLGKKEKDPASSYEHPKTPPLRFPHPLGSPTQKKRFLSPRKDKDDTPELCETPKISGKVLLRRRLHISISHLQDDSKMQNCSLENQISRVLHLESDACSSGSDSLRNHEFGPLVSSTLSPEDVAARSDKLRLSFSQQKTSTVDDSEDDCGLFGVECLSPIQGSGSQDSLCHDFSDSSLCVSDERTHPSLLGSSACGAAGGTEEDVFVTPISNLVASINFHARQRFSPSTEARGSISTPKDSGFNSLCGDRSDDSLSDQESSFQELFEKQKGALRAGDTIRRSRRLVRLRRLSTLREQGSQSETEEEQQVPTVPSGATPSMAPRSPEARLGSAEAGGALVFSLTDLSRTPALQLVHELFMTSKRKRFQQNGTQDALEERDEGRITVLRCVLAGLIGKKMGLEQLDILTELKQRDLKHVLAMVLDSLMAESLCSVWKVSRNWRDIIIQDKKANRRRKFYMAQLKLDSEEAILNVQDAGTRLQLLNRPALRSVQAQARTPSSQREQVPTVSPWGEVLSSGAGGSATRLHSKQEEYMKVAKTLFVDEALKPCPRCHSPAKYQPYQNRGLCSRAACSFDFCVLCLCDYHGAEECRRAAAKAKSRKDALPGSVQSKQNLKRL
ncbi:F-box only protein 43-like [Sorex fumeus]|uniref:F-box only protein 43-like n=1 Tax=Sorex fumeus TaxID=62283 RepID=UPI0024AE5279|nr:F-box only protein 43-like [Sorex fumeus]